MLVDALQTSSLQLRVTSRRPHEPSDLGDSKTQQEAAIDGAPCLKRQKWTVLGWRIRWAIDNGVTFS